MTGDKKKVKETGQAEEKGKRERGKSEKIEVQAGRHFLISLPCLWTTYVS